MGIDSIQPGTERDRAVGAMVGLAIGDALGAPITFADRDSLPRVNGLVGGGKASVGRLPALNGYRRSGEWTEPTSTTLCCAASLCSDGINPWYFMLLLERWRSRGCFQTGDSLGHRRLHLSNCFNIDDSTRWALGRFAQMNYSDKFRADDDVAVGSRAVRSANNGSLVRIAPVAVVWRDRIDKAEEVARAQSAVTHSAAEAREASAFYIRLLAEAICGSSAREVLRPRRRTERGAFLPSWNEFRPHEQSERHTVAEVAAGSWRDKTRDEIQSTPCVAHTLEAALWSIACGSTNRPLFVTDDSEYRRSILTAVNLGGDAAVIGAVTGQLAGALWGLSGIPAEWVLELDQREEIIDLADQLYNRSFDGVSDFLVSRYW